MKLKITPSVSNQDTWGKAGRFVSANFDDIVQMINGNLTFRDNILSQQLSVTFATPAVEVIVPHALGFIPNGYIVVGKSDDFNVYNGTTANSTTVLYLRGSAAGVASIIIF